MKCIRSITLLLLMLSTAAACSETTGLDAVDLEGTWNATVIEFTDNADSQNVVDILQSDGASLTLTVDADGTASSVFDDGVGDTDSDSGTLDSTGTTLTLGGQIFSASRNGNVMTLSDPNEQFDFGSGSEVPATLRIVLTRT